MDDNGEPAPPARRRFLQAGGSMAVAAAGLPLIGLVTQAQAKSPSRPHSQLATGKQPMTTMKMKDGTELFFKDWGSGPAIVFSHGWPLSADAWDSQMLFLGQQGYRVIAHDRRGHGRSQQTWTGNDMDTYADDLATLIEALNLKDATLVGHSTGGGEVARYIGRHGTKRLSKAVLISSVPPLMLKTEANPGGLPLSVFDGLRAGVAGNRADFYKGLAVPFFGFNRPNVKMEQGTVDSFWQQGMEGGIKAHYDCIKQFSETDFTGDLKAFDIPALVMQGDDDQIVPIADASLLSAKIIPDAKLVVIPGASHGMCTTSAERVNSELLNFLKS